MDKPDIIVFNSARCKILRRLILTFEYNRGVKQTHLLKLTLASSKYLITNKKIICNVYCERIKK